MLKIVLLFTILLPAIAWAERDAGHRFVLAQADDDFGLVWQPPEPIYHDIEPDSGDDSPPTIEADPSAFRLRGGVNTAVNERKDLNPDLSADRLSRLAEQRLQDSYGDDGWQTMAADAELRLADRTARQSGRVVPYITGGMALTQFGNGAIRTDTGSTATALRYGGGLAYGLGDALDVTAGYRVNRAEEAPLYLSPAERERLNVEMLDFGLKLRY
jgi:hypothetical protein